MYNYCEAINILVNNFSDLRDVYEKSIDDYENLPYLFYESEFVKFIMDKATKSNEDELRAIFDFVEDMLANGDAKVKNLIEVAVIESLYFENESVGKETMQKFFGKLTKKSFDECS